MSNSEAFESSIMGLTLGNPVEGSAGFQAAASGIPAGCIVSANRTLRSRKKIKVSILLVLLASGGVASQSQIAVDMLLRRALPGAKIPAPSCHLYFFTAPYVARLLGKNVRLREENRVLREGAITDRADAHFYKRMHRKAVERIAERDRQIEALKSKVSEEIQCCGSTQNHELQSRAAAHAPHRTDHASPDAPQCQQPQKENTRRRNP